MKTHKEVQEEEKNNFFLRTSVDSLLSKAYTFSHISKFPNVIILLARHIYIHTEAEAANE